MICDYLQAEVNVQKATNNANRSTRQMEETINEFQKQKLEDVKVGKKGKTNKHISQQDMTS